MPAKLALGQCLFGYTASGYTDDGLVIEELTGWTASGWCDKCEDCAMTTLAVVAHSKKVLGGGLAELRSELAVAGYPDVLWYEASKSRKVGARAAQAIADGADLIFIWGGDGTIQRCIDKVAGSGVAIALLPAGTGNLLARNLDIPIDLKSAVDVGLWGSRRMLDTGTLNGEHFAVMAGVGVDALMIQDADRGLKRRVGRAAYLWTGAKNLPGQRVRAVVKVDGAVVFKGKTSCILVGNVRRVLGGAAFFDQASPDDGMLDVGIIVAKGRGQWVRTLSRVAMGSVAESRFVRILSGEKISVTLDAAMAYELDGGARAKTRKLRYVVRPASITVCVPGSATGSQSSANAVS